MAETTEPLDDDFSEDEGDSTFKKFLSKYKLGNTIGTGGFSVVKRAVNRKTLEAAAVKIVKQAHAQGSILEREIEIMKKVGNHPNILTLHDVFQTKKNVYLVMELAEGGEVFDHIVKHGQYSERDASIVAKQIVEAVKYLHDHGVAHRDLKPQNLLCGAGGPTDIRIADFGLSKIFNSQTMMKTCCGSPEYVAPEILECTSYDNSVDMWSIGVIIYILLTGCFPFWSDNVQVLYKKILGGVYRWPAKPDVSDSAKDLVRRLLERDTTKRLTAAECLKHPWIAGQGVSTQTSSRDWKGVQDSRKKPTGGGTPRLPPI
jgi:serine/threonine protein kinase